MLTVYFCEDEKLLLSKYKSIVENFILIEEPDMRLEFVTVDPYELLEHKAGDDCTSLYFLDIELNTDMNGFQLAESIREMDPRGFMVFITSQSHLAALTFEYKLEAMDYIIKDDIGKVENRVVECLHKAYQRYTSAENQVRKVYSFKVGDRIRSIEMADIVGIETSRTAHKLTITTNNECIDYYGKLKEEFQKLDETFIYAHRSIIINVNHVEHIDLKKKIAIMDNGQTFTLSASGVKGIKERM